MEITFETLHTELKRPSFNEETLPVGAQASAAVQRSWR
jgi:hypothetical protein